MKQKLKQVTKVIAIVIVLLLSSCEKDLYENKIYQNNINKKIISVQDLEKSHPIAFSKYQKVEANCKKSRVHKKNVNRRLVYDGTLGFFN